MRACANATCTCARASKECLRALLPGGTKRWFKGKLEQRLTTAGPGGLAVVPEAVAREGAFVDPWFARTNCGRPTADGVAVYKSLWRVERASCTKSHPMFHRD